MMPWILLESTPLMPEKRGKISCHKLKGYHVLRGKLALALTDVLIWRKQLFIYQLRILLSCHSLHFLSLWILLLKDCLILPWSFVEADFRRSNVISRLDPHPLYLHAVLTYQSGSAYMLALVYSEILKVLRFWSLLDFDCEIFFPHDRYGLPRGYHKQKSAESDHPHILTVQTLLEEILKNVKEAFWPFQHDQSKSLFLRAVHAVLCTDRSNVVEESGFQLESAKSSHRRLDRGTLTSLHLGDLRLALSGTHVYDGVIFACERLILLEFDPKELRDYSVLLYHCGLYEQSLHYLKLYQDRKGSSLQKQASNELSSLEDEAGEKLMMRLNLISMEEGWSKPSHSGTFLRNNSEPS
ncbi:uncharacterized protein LOC133701545 isoform X4 [Populus nigra]|uniref:uncharacterized protein LOC133701545 isoform X4 n=1 Tax=Populus nigra TaxID=3691 RepID=UPI002B27697D|nr:uncharacterized protein LOC133701545 isoform X4 [Populus nigra]